MEIEPKNYIRLKKRWLKKNQEYPKSPQIMVNLAKIVRIYEVNYSIDLINQALLIEPENDKFKKILNDYNKFMI